MLVKPVAWGTYIYLNASVLATTVGTVRRGAVDGGGGRRSAPTLSIMNQLYEREREQMSSQLSRGSLVKFEGDAPGLPLHELGNAVAIILARRV